MDLATWLHFKTVLKIKKGYGEWEHYETKLALNCVIWYLCYTNIAFQIF